VVKKPTTKTTVKRQAKNPKLFKVVEKPQEPNKSFFDFLKFGESYTSLVLGIVVVVISTVLLLSFVHNKTESKTANPNPQILSQKTEKPSPTFTNSPKPTITLKPSVTIKPTKQPQPTVEQKKLTQATVAQIGNQNNTGNRSYTVAAGDTLWSISQKVYNSGYNWVDIARTNNLNDANMIHPGNKLVLPKAQVKVVKGTDSSVNTSSVSGTTTQAQQTLGTNKITGTSYKIVKGDTLWSIAVRAYGDGYQWVKIARTNNLNNPNTIHSNNTLSIPRS